MRTPLPFVFLAFAACAGTAGPDPLHEWLDAAPPGQTSRLWLRDDRVIAAAAPIDPHDLPPAARTTIEAVVPGGLLEFLGREWGERGFGYRIEKRYPDEAVPHVRTLLVAADGRVLERAHSIPISDAPQHVLATALNVGPTVDEVRIVSGPNREEHWSLTVRDRDGRTFVVEVEPDGQLRSTHRRTSSRIDY
jgi:hypothetical protein